MMRSVDIEHFFDGEGVVHFDHILEEDEMNEMNRVYAKVTLKKGCSVGYHVHHGDSEDYYVIKGTATIDDNHERILTLYPGEHHLTPAKKGHSLMNLHDEDLEVMALIIYDKKEDSNENCGNMCQ